MIRKSKALFLLFSLCLVAGARTQTVAAKAEHSGEEGNTVTNPVADPRAIVTAGHARFTVLTPQLIRMEWAADGVFEDHASFVFLNRHLAAPAFTVSHEGSGVTVKTAELTLIYTPEGDGKFTGTSLRVTFHLNGKEMVWRPGLRDTANLMGTTRTLDRARGNDLMEPMEPGLISRDGWTIVDDSKRPLFDSSDFSFRQGEKSEWPWLMLRPDGDRQDLYFFGYGHDYKQALHDFVEVAGRIPLPPRFAFGAWWSRYWAYSDQELDEIVRGFRENDVPLDTLVIDMDWHIGRDQLTAMHEKDQSGHGLGWSGYTWDKSLFPDPDAFLKHLHDEGLKVTLNLHPASGAQPWEEHYPEMARAMGIDPATRNYVPFDITNKKFATNYMDLLHHPLEKQGVNFWWLDWQQEPNTAIPGVSPTWWLNYVHFTDQEREGKRPMLFHRWGGLGNHRYQIGFSGDTISVWDSLAFQPWFTATAANVGYAYWSHDIGGHMPGVVDAELYTRWVQFGTFSPILRTHTTKNPDAERRIWAYPEPYADIMKDAFRLRYAIQPYLYTEARKTYDSGVAFLRPLYYDWPEREEAYANKNEYQFGDQMLVAPVNAPVDKDSGLARITVWIPEGEWIEWPTGRHFTGPRTLERSFSIDQIPVYVRAGAIVPQQPPMKYTGEKPVDPLILTVFPLANGKASSYTVYEDNSDGELYKRGVCAWTKIDAGQHGNDLQVDVAPVRGSYPGMLATRGYELRLPADWPPESVTVNGKALSFEARAGKPGWRYEGNALTTVVTIPASTVTRATRISVHRAAALSARRQELDGFAGKMSRLRAAYDTMNATWPNKWAPASLIDAMQSGDRLSYHPENAAREIEHFHAVELKAQGDLLNLIKQSDAAAQKAAALPNGEPAPKLAESHYRMLLKRARVLMEDATSPAMR